MPWKLDVGDRFGPPIPCAWLPDETLFSLCSRHHRLAGNATSAQTCLQLFGHRYQGSEHDLPNRLAVLADRAEGNLGDAVGIIQNHTVLPFYLPLLEPGTANRAVSAMLHGSVRGLRFFVGLTTSRFRANHPLKACPSCIAQDVHQHGVAYWHRGHQFPGVVLCPLHGDGLEESIHKSTGIGRFLWFLPDRDALHPLSYSATANHGTPDQALAAVSNAALGMGLLSNGFKFDPLRLRDVYADALARRDLLRGLTRLRRDAAGQQFQQFGRPLGAHEEFAGMFDDAAQASAHLARLLQIKRPARHPLWHVPAIAWLFGGWPDFMRAYESGCSGGSIRVARLAPPPVHRQVDDPRYAPFVSAIREHAWSVTRASKSVGADVGTGMAWAAKAGISVSRRAKVIVADVRTDIRRLLEAGAAKNAAAQRAGVSVQSVTRLLRTEPGLHDAWVKAVYAKRSRHWRVQWKLALRRSGNFAKAARTLAPAAYAWLYRNERAWLTATNLPIRPPRPISTPRVNWETRDAEYAREVFRISRTLRQSQPSRRAVRGDFYLWLPFLRAKADQLDRLPKTKLALDMAVSL